MNKIVISGYYGFANAGDEAMLTSIVRALRGVQPEIDLTVISGNPAETAARHQVKSIYRFNFLKIYNSIKKSDMLLSGGGSLLVLWLTWAVGLDAPSARLINLLFFIPAALCACFFRLRQGHLPLKKLWKAMALGCLAAAVSALWGSRMDTQLLQRLFGGLLVVTGIRELFYKPKKPS